MLLQQHMCRGATLRRILHGDCRRHNGAELRGAADAAHVSRSDTEELSERSESGVVRGSLTERSEVVQGSLRAEHVAADAACDD